MNAERVAANALLALSRGQPRQISPGSFEDLMRREVVMGPPTPPPMRAGLKEPRRRARTSATSAGRYAKYWWQ